MIQDIGHHNWNITYRSENPDEDSRILFFCQGKLFTIEENGNIHFPSYGQAEKFCQNKRLNYLFSLDGTNFFRCPMSEEESLHIIKEIAGDFRNRSYFRQVGPKELVLVAETGLHLDGWYSANTFCGKCGSRTFHDNYERMMRCPVCGNMIFPKINPAVIVGVVNGDKILLTKYRGREYKKYALVAGFTEIGESFEDTVRREVMEEAGIKVKNIRYYKSQPWGMADDILAGYYCEVDGDDRITMDDGELSVAEWVRGQDIPQEQDDLSLTSEMITMFRQGKWK